MSVIRLVGEQVAVAVEPERGASITHFGSGPAAKDNLLAHYDWKTPLPARLGPGYGDTTKDWLSEYRGGWQLLTPNAGDECVVSDVTHPCHGEVSRAEWVVAEVSDTSVTMWTGTHSALTVTRTIEVIGAGVRATTTLANETGVAVPAILTEHIAFAAGDDAIVRAPALSRWRTEPHGWGADEPDEGWADTRSRRRVMAGEEGVASLVAGSEGWIEIHRPALNRAARVEWSASDLPFLWHWQQRGSARFPWFGRADIVGLEPSSASRSNGLAEAVARGEAWMIGPEAIMSVSLDVRLVQCAGRL